MQKSDFNNSISKSTPIITVENGRRLEWNVRSSTLARNTHNRIRGIVESLKISPNPEKPMIPLSIGEFFLISGMLITERSRYVV